MSLVRCLFWNLHRSDRKELVSLAAESRDVDIIILIEHAGNSEATLETLRQSASESFVEPQNSLERFQVFCRGDEFGLEEVYGDVSGRVTVRSLRLGADELLFAAVHLPSKFHWDEADQAAEIRVLADQIRGEEDRRGHRRTIVVGDFNMNPFERGLVQASGLHAMASAETATAGSRVVQGREYPFFYNPMWGFFGDRTPGPPGTHFYRSSGHLSYDWNVFDQVLIRPDAMPWFTGHVEIVTMIGDTDLRDRMGRPNSEVASDHFPILFELQVTD